MFMHETVLAAYADLAALCPCSHLHFSGNGIRLGCVTPLQLHFPLPDCILIHGSGLDAFHHARCEEVGGWYGFLLSSWGT